MKDLKLTDLKVLENATGKFSIKNGTITSVDGGGSGADFKSKAQGSVTNVKWANFTGGSTVKIRASFNADCTVKTDAMSHLTAGDLSFTTVEFAAIKVYSDQDCATELAAAQASAEASVTIGTATGVSDATCVCQLDGCCSGRPSLRDDFRGNI